MTDEQRNQISRGEHAERLLRDPLMQEVLGRMQTDVRDLFFELPPEAAAQREQLHQMDRMRRQFVQYLHALMDGAAVAKQEILLEENMAVKAASIMERVRNG